MSRLYVVPSIVLLIFLSSTLGLAQSSGRVNIQWGDHPTAPSPPPPGPVYQQPGGPPPHAPTRLQSKAPVPVLPVPERYYEQARGMYFYMSGNGWPFGASLPGSLTVSSLGTHVSIGLDTGHPYEFNHEHVVKYPKEKYRGKGKDDGDDDQGKALIRDSA